MIGQQQTATERWDEWFGACNDDEIARTWAAVKEVFAGEEDRERWATIIELNRIDKHYRQAAEQRKSPG